MSYSVLAMFLLPLLFLLAAGIISSADGADLESRKDLSSSGNELKDVDVFLIALSREQFPQLASLLRSLDLFLPSYRRLHVLIRPADSRHIYLYVPHRPSISVHLLDGIVTSDIAPLRRLRGDRAVPPQQSRSGSVLETVLSSLSRAASLSLTPRASAAVSIRPIITRVTPVAKERGNLTSRVPSNRLFPLLSLPETESLLPLWATLMVDRFVFHAKYVMFMDTSSVLALPVSRNMLLDRRYDSPIRTPLPLKQREKLFHSDFFRDLLGNNSATPEQSYAYTSPFLVPVESLKSLQAHILHSYPFPSAGTGGSTSVETVLLHWYTRHSMRKDFLQGLNDAPRYLWTTLQSQSHTPSKYSDVLLSFGRVNLTQYLATSEDTPPAVIIEDSVWQSMAEVRVHLGMCLKRSIESESKGESEQVLRLDALHRIEEYLMNVEVSTLSGNGTETDRKKRSRFESYREKFLLGS